MAMLVPNSLMHCSDILSVSVQVTVARHFDHRFRSFLKYLKTEPYPLGEIEDHFWRVEFQR